MVFQDRCPGPYLGFRYLGEIVCLAHQISAVSYNQDRVFGQP